MTRLMAAATAAVTGAACFAGGLSVPRPREVVVLRPPPTDCSGEVERLRAELDRREIQIELIRSEIDEQQSLTAVARNLVLDLFSR